MKVIKTRIHNVVDSNKIQYLKRLLIVDYWSTIFARKKTFLIKLVAVEAHFLNIGLEYHLFCWQAVC